MKPNVLSIIIPVFNEAQTIYSLLSILASVELDNKLQKEIIIVNDASSDNSVEIISNFLQAHPKLNIRVIHHQQNQGKGAAIHTGIKATTGIYTIIQDADLEYDPREFNLLLKPLTEGHADVVFGSRFRGSHPHRILFFWHSIGNRFLTFLTNVVTNLNLTDMETCYKLFKTDQLKALQLKEKKFGFEPEVTIKIARVPGIRIYETGISYYGRTYEEGKKIGWKDGIRALYCILHYGLFSK